VYLFAATGAVMSFAKRQFDLREKGVQARIEAWLAEPEEKMAKLRVKSDVEEIVIYQAYNPEPEVRLSINEVEEFVKELDQATDEATRCSENRLAEEVRNLTPHVFSKDEIE
jgi:hypothetical protein